MKTEFAREELIDLCDRAIVQESAWRNRDSQSAQLNVGKLWALLKAGCEYTIEEVGIGTISIQVTSKGFRSFTYGDSWENLEVDDFYLPTPDVLDNSNGKDWY